MILPKDRDPRFTDRDPRFTTIRGGGTLTDSDHRLLAFWADPCAEHVPHLFESVQPSDPRPRDAIEQIRAWACGEITMSRAAAGHAMAAARGLSRTSMALHCHDGAYQYRQPMWRYTQVRSRQPSNRSANYGPNQNREQGIQR